VTQDKPASLGLCSSSYQATNGVMNVLPSCLHPVLIASQSLPPNSIDIRNLVLNLFLKIFIVVLFICAYKAWVISPPPHPYHPLRPIPLPPTPSIPGRNYFALISNFVVERV
jgi:hypothetical protein